MRWYSVITPLARGALIAHAGAAEQRPLGGRLPPNVRRHFMSCEETYGQGWNPCGNEVRRLRACGMAHNSWCADVSVSKQNSTFCYNPNHGQSCCKVDNGYCDAGTHCAPVAGYCCIDGEDLETCAKNAGFELPARYMILVEPATSVGELATSTRVEDTSRISGASLNTPALGVNSSSAGLTVPSVTSSGSVYIQVSVARKEQWTLAWMGAGIGAVGLFMFSC
ncbi:hypothetical protein B0T25DRAFT_332224 [Lasiosphaeria hispida]|uniref:Uncharacterized protein n=1 Tax=Lasiosphaeria hispida TaxID=260671 RepID=A0AAJ0H5W9_9PEZI|nr:hypothetical protein B0T25DRAFT_332224 [Lasiosphaeria hispida]